MLNLDFLRRDKDIKSQPIQSVSGADGSHRQVRTPDTVECKAFRVFGAHDFNLNLKRHLPARSISKLRKCLVHGQSAALFTYRGRRQAIHWSALPELDLSTPAGNYTNFFERKGDTWRLINNPKLLATRFVENGILIGSRYSFNYFHFVCDSLVRALIADEYEGCHGWPLVITDAAPQIAQITQMLFPRREILVLKADELVHFETLIVPVSSSFSPDDPGLASHAVFDAPYLNELRSRLVGQQISRSSSERPRVIFVKRSPYTAPDGSMARSIINQDEVIRFLEAFGATIISPEHMSVVEQREAFNSADVIVALAGAALTNTIFCRPGTSIVSISQDRVVSPEYFGIMFGELGLNYVVVASPPVMHSNPHPSHRSVNVELSNLARALAHVTRT